VDGADDIKPEWLEGRQSLGVTAGASAPEVLVKGVINRLIELGAEQPEELEGEQENIVFTMPKELRSVEL
jgi:4-hydroxy-3-methylbut-2-enyl diphosphate reductase